MMMMNITKSIAIDVGNLMIQLWKNHFAYLE